MVLIIERLNNCSKEIRQKLRRFFQQFDRSQNCFLLDEFVTAANALGYYKRTLSTSLCSSVASSGVQTSLSTQSAKPTKLLLV